MKRMPTLASIMTPFPYSIDREAPLQDAERLMKSQDIHHLPVTSAGRLVGVISIRDVELAISPFNRLADNSEWQVKDLCSDDAYIVNLHATVIDVLSEMSERHMDSALVTKHDRLVGIITHSDVCRRFSELLQVWFPDGGDDVVA